MIELDNYLFKAILVGEAGSFVCCKSISELMKRHIRERLFI
jgi:hypothetical protein